MFALDDPEAGRLLFHGCGLELYRTFAKSSRHLLIYDPPWDRIAELPCLDSDNILAFCDGRRAADVVRMFGAPTWVFTWDCVSSWWTKGRPLQRAKYAFWYGDSAQYQPEGRRLPGAPRTPKRVKNSRSSYWFEPKPGRQLSDLYSAPIARLHAGETHRHSKPLQWVAALVGCCARPGDVVLDPFAGSGTSLQAARICGLPWVGAEIDGKAVELLRALPFPTDAVPLE